MATRQEFAYGIIGARATRRPGPSLGKRFSPRIEQDKSPTCWREGFRIRLAGNSRLTGPQRKQSLLAGALPQLEDLLSLPGGSSHACRRCLARYITAGFGTFILDYFLLRSRTPPYPDGVLARPPAGPISEVHETLQEVVDEDFSGAALRSQIPVWSRRSDECLIHPCELPCAQLSGSVRRCRLSCLLALHSAQSVKYTRST